MKILPALLRETSKKQKKIKNKLESHKKECENKDFCGAVIPSEDTKT